MIEVARNQTAAIARLDLRAVLTVRLSRKIRHEQLDQNVYARESPSVVRFIHTQCPLHWRSSCLTCPHSLSPFPAASCRPTTLARRVITNELHFQGDHTNWMYRLEKEQFGKKQVEEVIETKEGSLSRLLSINDLPLSANSRRKRPSEYGS